MIRTPLTKRNEYFVLVSILVITFFVYLNHFDNPFFFDDTHTITNNESITNLKNWPSFFTNADTFSSLPANRSYRPMITLMNAIDYSIGGGLYSNYYHYHIFFWFLVLIILVFKLSKKLYKLSKPNSSWIGITALFTTAWFSLHAANAETINYICARSDSFTTLCVVASLLLYINPIGKKWHLYLITMVIGIWTKQTGVMFFPILFCYVILFEENSLIDDFKINKKEKLIRIIKKIAPTGLIAFGLFIFNQYYLTPSATVSTNFTITKFEYISTQFFVTAHYLGSFVLPINLSADPDITIIKPWYDFRILLGLVIIIGLIFIMLKTALKKELRPIAFGIAWFFIALLPTALNPLFQIANDHRMFFPFVGLFIAVPWSVLILSTKYTLHTKFKYYSTFITTLVIITLFGHAYGTVQRSNVWDSYETLWKDVTLKSPKNGRGLMNYGLTLMSKGNYDEALEYFNKAFQLTPNYYSLHINLGIVYGAKKDYVKAEQYFKSAIAMNSSSPAPEYFYARYLSKQKKYKQSQKLLKKALTKSPNHIASKKLLKIVSKKIISPEEEIKALVNKIKKDPTPDNYINLSLKYYETKNFELAITTCKELLKIDPKNIAAYNNICSSYNQMKQWRLGAKACKKALEIDPNYKLAKNNLKWANDNID
ncbi:tetratricopeptide repeat protein [Aquimarina sp. AD10]|uniref:tetratricopeptide repeat protein n=1 Tax=Aquimarina sp. AD10 TaxID=1714849 RepID=UPI000E4CFDAD|nr:tetratricopeptide repeat protein [Aquimarina sp. AD10]AXT60798.1 tetratricopeptide repeat protein [Aquimarina sp. AD10]RKM98502.1 tetratricopeptide repeat protein [Aquimarina sp. AD10]